MRRKIWSVKYVATVLLTLTVLILGGLNAQQKRRYIPPDDGAAWVEGTEGIQARLVVPDGPAEKASIRRGDVLRAINGQAVENDRHVTRFLYELGAWSRATYTIDRDGKEFDTTVVVGPAPEQSLRHQKYLEIIGLIYFLVGCFVLLKRSRAPHAPPPAARTLEPHRDGPRAAPVIDHRARLDEPVGHLAHLNGTHHDPGRPVVRIMKGSVTRDAVRKA